MKNINNFNKQYVWLGCITIGPLIAYAAVFYPGLSVLAVAFFLVGLNGVLLDILD